MPSTHNAGVEIHYEIEGQGPKVLLIQGVGVIGNGWRPQIMGLRDRFTLLTFDNRGIGKSGLPTGAPISVEAMASDALAVMDAAGWQSAHVVGHSLGGVIAQQVALDAPARVRSLGLLCTFHRGRDGAALNFDMFIAALRTRIGPRRMRRRAFLELIAPPEALGDRDRDALAQEYAPLFGHDLADQPSIVMKQVRALGRHDVSAKLSTLASIPTLVLSGRRDRIARPDTAHALANAIPGARHIELPDDGHGVPIYRADEVNRILAEHFRAAEGA